MAPVRILLVDDSPEFLESAERLLAADPQIAIVGRARSGAEALDLVERTYPDLALVDLSMPDMNGLETTWWIKARPAPPRVIIMTLYDEPEYRAAAAEAGADGFLPKSRFYRHLSALITHLFVTAMAGAPAAGTLAVPADD